MAKIIIGIHGLANRPPKDVHEQWWKKALVEGLEKNCQMQNPTFDFQMVHWADLLYKYPLHTDENFSFDSMYYDPEPYREAKQEALKEYKDGFLNEVEAGALAIVGAGVDALKRHFGMDALADWFLGKLLKDLAFYYDDHRMIANRQGQRELARKVLRDALKNALLPLTGQDIMLIAHSMGTIISYDVLRDLGRSDPDLQISHFVTIGSPLGLPHVKGKIIEERGYDPRVRTPSIVTKSWVNFADRKDPVAMDVHLSDDYEKNATGVRVRDDLVYNDYQRPDGGRNHHKAYGYLRTPGLSRHVEAFLK